MVIRLRQRLGQALGRQPPSSFVRNSVLRLSQQAHTLLLMSEEEIGIAALEQAFGPKLMVPGATVKIVREIDHALTTPSMRRIAADHIIEFLRQAG